MFEVGSIVKAVSGRDKHQFYVVVTLDEGFAYIADGKRRKLGKPKKKNLKHLSVTAKKVNLADVKSDKSLRGILEPMNQSLNKSTTKVGGN